MGLAQTGTGKTLAFGIPMLDAIFRSPGKPAPKTAKALILAPTRELVNQIAQSLRSLTAQTKIRVNTVVGGASIGKQLQTAFTRDRCACGDARSTDRPVGQRRY